VVFALSSFPPDVGVTVAHQGDETTDSDADASGTTPNTGLLPSGATDLDLDMGLAQVDLVIDKSAVVTQAMVGGVVTFTLAYTNDGLGVASMAFITETVPAYSTFNAAQSTAGWDCPEGAPAGTECRIELGTLNPGDSGSVIFAVTVNSDVPDDQTGLFNCASISSATGDGPDADLTSCIHIPITPPTALEPGEQPDASGWLYLPSIQSKP
jgi:uncharacterized repeat protein (TIGR01451 family)